VRQDGPQASAVAAGQDAPESSPAIPSLPTVQDAPQASQSAPIVSLAPYQAPRVEIVAPTALARARDASTDDHGLTDAWTPEPEPDDLTRQVRRKVGRQRLYTCACNPHHAETVKGYVRSRGECDLCESTDGIEFHDYGTPGWYAALAFMVENARLDAQLAAQVREASRERLATAMADRRRGILRSV
jgi:hypothetical protein